MRPKNIRAYNPHMVKETTACPRCGRRTIKKRDGIFRWRICPAVKSCGWTVFNHGDDPRDKAAA